MRSPWFVCLMALTFTASAGPQGSDTESLAVGGADLRLGMSEQDARAKLHSYKLEKIQDSNGFFVQDESGRGLGVIAFENGKLSVATREWSVDKAEPMRAAIGALTSLAQACGEMVSLRVGRNLNPTFALDYAEIKCAGRRVFISSGNGSTVSEQLMQIPH